MTLESHDQRDNKDGKIGATESSERVKGSKVEDKDPFYPAENDLSKSKLAY